MKGRDLAVLTAATGLSRFAFRSHYLYDIDSVNFALALRRFDPSVHQPHPPGYFLYVCLGRLMNLIFADANTALVAISILFSCGAAAMIYLLADRWFGRDAARFAGAIFLFSPLAWFHGTVALTYIVEAFFSALVGYLCWRVYTGRAEFVLPAALAIGIAAGFRPSSALFLGPLFLFSLKGVSTQRAALGIAVWGAATFAWFIPMIRISGAGAYMSSLYSLWSTVPAKSSVFNSSILSSVVRAMVIAGIYLLCFGCAAVLPSLRSGNGDQGGRQNVVFTAVWIAPGLLFFTFVFLKFVNSGYLLILMPPVCAWMGQSMAGWYRASRIPGAGKMLLAGGCAAANVAVFLFAPFYCSYGEVRRFERELTAIVTTLPQIAPAGAAMIVGMDSHFFGYRHAGYYLPGYRTVQFPEVRVAAGQSVFAMLDRETAVEQSLATGSIQDFVLFPLPLNDPEYSNYMAHVRARLPADDLRLVTRGGYQYVVGPVRDLHFLFPAVAAQGASQVVAGANHTDLQAISP